MEDQLVLVESEDRDPQNYNAYLKVRIILLVPGDLLNPAIRNSENTLTANTAFDSFEWLCTSVINLCTFRFPLSRPT